MFYRLLGGAGRWRRRKGRAGGRGLMDPQRDLLDEIREEVRGTADWTGCAALSPRVMEALGKVPRHEFVSASQADRAYDNAPLPIGHGQTISQPYIVALMTELLDPEPGDVVLEVGTGSGYQAAVLAELVQRVYTIEVIPELAEGASRRLARLGYANVEVSGDDGSRGWPEHAPYDGIVVTAAGRDVPPALAAQLKPGGRMVIPLGAAYAAQELTLVEKDAEGNLERRSVLPVAFVPLQGGG